MKNAGKLQDAMDDAMEIPNRIGSTVEELSRYYDPETTEYVFTLRYKARVAPDAKPVKPCKVKPLIDVIFDR
jgi:hypothetical protein